MVKIELSNEEALVIYEFLARHDAIDNKLDEGKQITSLQIEDKAELYSLWQLYGALELRLVEPLDPEYNELVKKARRSVRIQWGDE